MQALSELGVIAVGVCNASPDVRAVALTAGLPHMMLSHAKSIATAVSSGGGASPATAGESLNEHVTATSTAAPPAAAAAVSYGQQQAAQQQQHTAAAQPVTHSSSNSSSSASSSNSSSSASSTAQQRQQQQQQQHRSSAATTTATATAASDAAADDSSTGSSGDTPAADAVEAMVYTGTVRSGQQVYAQGRSLIVVGSVSRLGEVLADGGSTQSMCILRLHCNYSKACFASAMRYTLVVVVMLAASSCRAQQRYDQKHSINQLLLQCSVASTVPQRWERQAVHVKLIYHIVLLAVFAQ
jgi:hypothetical protein